MWAVLDNLLACLLISDFTNTLVWLVRAYKIRHLFYQPKKYLEYAFYNGNPSPAFGMMKMSRKYADDINLNCLDLQIPFFSELALGPGCINRRKQTEHLKFHQIQIDFFAIFIFY